MTTKHRLTWAQAALIAALIFVLEGIILISVLLGGW